MSIPPFNTTVTFKHLSPKTPHILPVWSLRLWGQLLLTGLLLYAVAVRHSIKHPPTTPPHMPVGATEFSLCQRVQSLRMAQKLGYRGWVKGEWENFPWKEIKLKRMIKAWFPASWFVFWAEIPFFLFFFAETTVTALPVWLTVTPKTLFLVGSTLLWQPGR